MTTQLWVRKGHLHDTSLRQLPDGTLAQGQVRLRIERFALTSNNITYGAFGDAMHYWDFYPTGEDGWGIIPVWGFGTVVQSEHDGLAVGERIYGYFPMADTVVLSPGRLSETAFTDSSPHRTTLPRVYNQYLRCTSDPFYSPDTEAVQALLRPLFTTSWLIDDFLADNDFFGARVVVLSSASSKTAYGTAFALARRGGIEVVGLTSAANRSFCESLGCYARVLTYAQLAQIGPADLPCVYVDFAGNAELRRSLHSRLSGLRYSCSIGGTHVDQLGSAKDLPGPKPVLSFLRRPRLPSDMPSGVALCSSSAWWRPGGLSARWCRIRRNRGCRCSSTRGQRPHAQPTNGCWPGRVIRVWGMFWRFRHMPPRPAGVILGILGTP